MKRNIISIDADKCNGCGLCVNACHEGALAMVDGKAVLVSDSYCDGLGACLPACPTDAIQIIEREADEFNEEMVKARMAQMPSKPAGHAHAHAHGHHGCPSSRAVINERANAPAHQPAAAGAQTDAPSRLRQWPCQIKLVNPAAPYLQGAHLLIAADCAAYAFANFHERFMTGKITLIGCPKLDEGDYSEKLADILAHCDIQSITVARMEVPCCGGLVSAVQRAMQMSGVVIPWQVVTIGTQGDLV